ncbi:hypothetical protein KFK09_013316 [Dendrobium nobile]|uniref:Uncharacterized protein n=1 Tax=Dendrobium nobile TaxID=94219 RepID=A0A8T3B8H2_DENNO|nr:hypothetical protein KFK09_013316 [Dendrobium nobile]
MKMRKGRIRHIKAFTGLRSFISCHVCGSMVGVTSSTWLNLTYAKSNIRICGRPPPTAARDALSIMIGRKGRISH